MKGGGSLFVLIILLITCLYTSSVFSQGTLPPDFPSRGTRETIQVCFFLSKLIVYFLLFSN